MRLLDLFCGAGGAAVGYHRAGFTEIVGVDIKPQPRYPFTFVLGDALEYVKAHGREFDAIHASPPCQRYSRATPHRTRARHPDLLPAVRDALRVLGTPWILENVELSPMPAAVVICGSAFGLPIKRHRWFEASIRISGSQCHHSQLPKTVRIFRHGAWYLSRFVNIYGTGGGKARAQWPAAMGIDWMTPAELTEAIPPAYTYFIGCQLIQALRSSP